jgi:hypothetical protein
MSNERLRDAMMAAGVTTDVAADQLGLDPKSVERWLTTQRVPHARNRRAIAAMVHQPESYLWPSAVPPQRQAQIAQSEIVAAFPHRGSVPSDLWDKLIDDASDRIDILVHAGQFLAERPGFVRTLAEKAGDGVTVRINFGNPDAEATERRSAEEGLGQGVLAARIRYGLVPYKPLLGTRGVEFRFHETTLYNSIFRFDGDMIVNTHVYGVPGAHAPALHLRKLGAGDLFDTYARSFVDVWNQSSPAEW